MNMKLRKALLGWAVMAVLVTVLVYACSSFPGAGSPVWGGLGGPSNQLPFMEKVRTGTLPSGLRYFILENSKPENRAYLTLAVNVGSVFEEEDEQGLAHFVEHMAFNGTARFPKNDLINYLRSLGMSFGAHQNAYTSFDRTVYRIEVPVSDDNGIRHIPGTVMAIIDDWSRAITFAPADVDDERPVIMEEYRSRLGAGERLGRQWWPVFYRGSPYAQRLPIGLPEIIETAPASRLEGFYKKWYRADNMALIFVGDFDGAALEASLAEHFLIEKPAVPTVRPVYDLPAPKKGVEVLILTDPELTGTSVSLYFKRDREAIRGDLLSYRNGLINRLISSMLTLRFNDEVLKPETPYISAGAGTNREAASSRFYVMGAVAKSGSAEASLNELLRVKETMLRYGFTDAELALAVDSMLSGKRRAVAEKDKLQSGGYANSLVSYFLDGGYLTDDEWDIDAYERLLPHIKAKDINAAIKDYFASGDITVFISAPDSELASLPGEMRVRQMVTQSGKMKIARPKSITVDEVLLLDIPQRGEVVSESVDGETGAVIWELGNGAKVILKSTNNQNDQIVMQAIARGGITSVKPEDDISANLAAEMVQVSGLGPWSIPELRRKLSGKQLGLSRLVSSYTRGFEGSSTTGDLKTFFEMLYLNFTDPRIDPVAVQVMMDSIATSLAHRDENPGTVFSDEIIRTMYGGHPHFKPLELADLPKADIDTALAFIRKGLNPADYTFVFTGNLDNAGMQNYIETYIASIPPGETWNEWKDLGITRPGKVERTVYKGKEEQSWVRMAWFVNASFSGKLSAETQVLSEYLAIKLTEEIREKLGGVYSISAGVGVSAVPRGEMSMWVFFGCDPKRVQELSTAVIDLLNQTARSIDRDTFGKAVEALKKGWETAMQSNSTIAGSYVSSVLLNLPLSRLNNLPRVYDAVTPADIQNVCARLLPNGPARVVLYPETK